MAADDRKVVGQKLAKEKERLSRQMSAAAQGLLSLEIAPVLIISQVVDTLIQSSIPVLGSVVKAPVQVLAKSPIKAATNAPTKSPIKAPPKAPLKAPVAATQVKQVEIIQDKQVDDSQAEYDDFASSDSDLEPVHSGQDHKPSDNQERKRDPAIQANSAHLGAQGLAQYPGILGIESLVFAAFTTVTLEYFGPPICMPGAPVMIGASATCNPWYGANVATNGVPLPINKPSTGPSISNTTRDIQYPTISPERMQLAIYKLFGEAAIVLMASGPGPWTGNLTGPQLTNYLVPGKVPYTLVIILLGIWTFITALPSCWTLFERRWAATLDGFEMFRLGAEWRDVVWKFEGSEITENKILTGVPGMVGDMDPRGERGVVGLSWTEARVKGRRYTYDRASTRR